MQMEIGALEGNERVREIARLISGETITQTSLAHAKELLDKPDKKNNKVSSRTSGKTHLSR
jgi:DNA repair ATPase RecN